MLSYEDVTLFLNEPVKLVKKNDFVLYGHIESVSKDALVFLTIDGVKSVIILEAVKEIVQRNNRGRPCYQ